MSRNIDDLIPEARLPYLAAKNECAEKGLIVVETCVKRKLEEQVALYAQGRESFNEICKLRDYAGLWPIAEDEAAKVITWTFLSKHIAQYAMPRDHKDFGKVLAVDFALKHFVDGKSKLYWNSKVDVNENEVPDFEEAGAIFEHHGFVWGGRWSTPDRPHIEWAV
jgi:hypothetical protein